MRKRPAPYPPTPRHHQLRGPLASAVRNGKALSQWQIEVTGAGRLWYLFDAEKRVCWLVKATTGHPRETD
ncbi:hypothetical protein [Streptomyces griseocarneus]|uniref:hypothetical protein n=1 Tax=Streptomyces griseocarneus TaxID=51201 RepID=UPI001CC91CCE|nr:hypothetical protein [Streptomyces griseocarneus]MBZ6475016.1 hypothetical protein [Streptomyces griseocarneus]